MTELYTTNEIMGQLVSRCIYNKLPPLDSTRAQILLYYVRNQFMSELGTVGFEENICATSRGPRVNSIRKNLSRFRGPIPYEELRIIYPRIKGFDTNVSALIYRVVDPTGDMSNKMLLTLANRQKPYQKALLSKTKIVRPEDTAKFFCR